MDLAIDSVVPISDQGSASGRFRRPSADAVGPCSTTQNGTHMSGHSAHHLCRKPVMRKPMYVLSWMRTIYFCSSFRRTNGKKKRRAQEAAGAADRRGDRCLSDKQLQANAYSQSESYRSQGHNQELRWLGSRPFSTRFSLPPNSPKVLNLACFLLNALLCMPTSLTWLAPFAV